MPLTVDNIAEIRSLGEEGFHIYIQGKQRLKNVNGMCFFLEAGKCKIYSNRPEGCRLYPLVISEKGDKVGYDEDCPHHDEFHYTQKDVEKILNLFRNLGKTSRIP